MVSSRHMTGEKNYLKKLRPYSNNYVTFGHGVKGNIAGKGKLDYPDLHILNEILLVKALNVNLISVI